MNKKSTLLREGITTGTCATAAVVAASRLLKEGVVPHVVEVQAPGGLLRVEPQWARLVEGGAEAGVVKDAGDDPDVTHGMVVCSRVIPRTDGQFHLAAGEGVGTVTLPGLKVPPGEPAINPVPRSMILAVLEEAFPDGADVTVSIPGGEEAALRTYNSRLGVMGGLSVLGTTGIVRPMSEEALRATFKADLDVKAALGRRHLAFVFGNMGEAMTKNRLNLADSSLVEMGNEVGYMLKEAHRAGLLGLLLAGHAGKMVKLAGGIFNTHSRVADGRMEVLCTLAALEGASRSVIEKLDAMTTTEAARPLLHDAGLDCVWQKAAERACRRARTYLWNDVPIEVLMMDNDGQILGATEGVEEMARLIREEDR